MRLMVSGGGGNAGARMLRTVRSSPSIKLPSAGAKALALAPTLALAGAIVLSSCMSEQHSRKPPVDPDVARAQIAKLIPAKTASRDAWAADIFVAFEALKISPTPQHSCAVIALTQQESGLKADPEVPGLSAIARREIEARADRFGIPEAVVSAALRLESPDGRTYGARLDAASTEKDLSELFEDFIGMVPLGARLFADWNPVRTGGPMQVSIAYAEKHARSQHYPYPASQGIRREVFTRRGGLYFGIAHLLDYPAPYRDMRYRFADYNAGHYASRNAAFQNALSIVAKTPLALDGDLLRHGGGSSDPSRTELAARKLAQRIDLDDAQIHEDLEKGEKDGFERTRVYKRVFEMADGGRKRALPRALIPQIRLQSAKITRKLTTEWFAKRVEERYRRCLASAAPG